MNDKQASDAAATQEPVLVVAPGGRDAAVICTMLAQAGVNCTESDHLRDLVAAFPEQRYSAAVVVQEAFLDVDLEELQLAIAQQQPWSDFPFILLAHKGGLPRTFAGLVDLLGNVTILERPLHPVTLVSAARSALRARARQYQARDYLREREEAEKALRELADTLELRIAERTRQLSAANDRLTAEIGERERTEERLRQAQKMEAIGRLTGGVAHDFNNLLFAVIGNLDMLTRRIDDEKSLRMLNNALHAAERGSKLTAQLLAFSRRQRLAPEPVNVNKLIAGMGELLASTIGSTVRIETALQEEAWHALVDPTQLEMVILNLAINARDAMPAGGKLTIQSQNVEKAPASLWDELSPEGCYVMVSVSDTGTGMLPEIATRAFEPFFTTKEAGKGSGLGLSQVFGFARQSGGTVRLDTEIGHGTTVRIYLPRTDARAADSKVKPRVSSAVDKKSILVVDDDRDVRNVLVAMLQDLGYEVVAAETGAEALRQLGTNHIDLLLTDVAMPDMNGLDVARAARERRSGLPVLFATGYADLEWIGASLDDEEVIRKPYRAAELSERLSRALDARPQASPSPPVPVTNP